MGRQPRPSGDGTYHLAAHGSDTRHLFLDADDRRAFLARLGATCERFELELLSYSLMGNHYHALLTAGGSFAPALRELHAGYARSHNRRHGRRAHLFRAHAYIGEVASSEQLVTVARYLAMNPVEVGLANDPFAWPWSSAAAHAGLAEPALPLRELDLAGAFGGGARWRARYRNYVLE